jgi:redox-sensitive bicupin YhaK (pirin superfamily)
MTAGSGIIHQEMPKGDKKKVMAGFQLWANLPASHKMMAPRYRDVKSQQIPKISLGLSTPHTPSDYLHDSFNGSMDSNCESL